MQPTAQAPDNGAPFNILSLDGGGSKGVYTLGVLKELEQMWDQPLHLRFDMVFGTSTGAIIAALIALGHTIAEIERMYFELIPSVMRHRTRKGRSRALRAHAAQIVGGRRFEDAKCRLGIVATNSERERPMIFKSHADSAYSLKSSFRPGFGCTIDQALLASAAAFPFFERVHVETHNAGSPEVLDGGFCANNPTLLAVADAHSSLGIPIHRMRVLSVGVGHYKEPNKSVLHALAFRLWWFQLIQTMFGTGTNTMEELRKILFPALACVRIDDSFPDDRYSTDLLESDPAKLRKLFVLGRESFGEHEKKVTALFHDPRSE